ncbi:MAG TPA: PAS domain S-box protein [Thermomicrobiales bacterium]|nr:PAS domain S-box protein [Thermomicrobiales bacterium]
MTDANRHGVDVTPTVLEGAEYGVTVAERSSDAPVQITPLTPEEFGLGQLFWELRDAVVVGNVETGGIVLWNPAAADLFGIPVDEAVGLSIETLIPEDLREQHRAGLAGFRETGGGALIDAGLPVELSARRRTGERITVELSLSPITMCAVPGRFVLAIIRDTTLRKQAEMDRLRQSEERFQTAFDHAATGMSLVDLDGRFLRVNTALCALTGYAEPELLAMTFQAITHPDDLAADLAQVDRLLSGEIPAFQMEKRYVRKDGKILWIRLSTSIVRDEHGAPLYTFGQLEDITARIEAEAVLRHSEARFRSLIANASDLITILGVDGAISYVSPPITRILGYDDVELVGRNAFDFVHPAERDAIWATFVQALVEPELQPVVEFRFQHKDGSWRWLESTGTNLLADDDVGGFVVNSRDITERKRVEGDLQEAEAKYRTLVEQLPAVVYIQADDAHYTPLFYNTYIETLTGETIEEVMARTGDWLDNVHPEDRERVNSDDAWGGPVGHVFSAEYRRRHKDGSYVWVRDECVPLHDDAGQIIAWQGVMLDISNRKRAEEELQTALEGAQAANRAKSVFLDMMSHELRTPLQATLGYSEFLLHGPTGSLTAEQREDIGYIHQAGARMITLINQLLDLSRMEAGHL